MSLQTRLKRLEQRKPAISFRPAIILDDLIAPDNVEEDESILGLTELCWGEPQGKVWMHGGTNPGAPKGNRNAWKHDARSAETMEAMRYVKAVARLVNKLR
jgi:hypothetical protein